MLYPGRGQTEAGRDSLWTVVVPLAQFGNSQGLRFSRGPGPPARAHCLPPQPGPNVLQVANEPAHMPTGSLRKKGRKERREEGGAGEEKEEKEGNSSYAELLRFGN